MTTTDRSRKPSVGKALVLVMCLALPVSGFSQNAVDRLDFAESLMADKDFFRAITEYKRISFYSSDEEVKRNCAYTIALAYLQSNHFSLSLAYLDALVNLSHVPEKLLLKANLLYGINFYCLHEPVLARNYFDKSVNADTSGMPELFLGLLSAEDSEWQEASGFFQAAADKAGTTGYGLLALELSKDILAGETLDSRSPFLAGVFSAVLPGSGQVYTGHLFDGLNAFTMVGLFGFTTYLSFSYESQRNNGHYVYTAISGIITSLFYFSNIIGAARTADYYTAKQRQDFLDEIRSRIFDTVQ